MQEKPVRTDWTPLGYHPNNPKDMTPLWVHVAALVVINTLLLFAILRYLATGEDATRVYFHSIVAVFGIYLLTKVAFNWRRGEYGVAGRTFDLIMSCFLVVLGGYNLLKP